MELLVSGSLAYDKIMEYPGRFGDHVVADKAHSINISFVTEKLREHFGGTAGNIAYGLALLGEKPKVLASAGHDFEAYRSWLISVGVDVSLVRIVSDKATTLSNIMTDRADNQIAALYLGSMADSCEAKDADIPTDSLAIIAPGNIDDMRRLPGVYRAKHIPFIFDPAQQIPALDVEDIKSGITGAKALIANDYELAMVLQKTGWTEDDILREAEMLVVTLGEKGSRIRTREKTFEIPPVEVKGVLDPTGAGDAYRAGFMKGMVMGWSLDVIGRFAGIIAARVVEVYGPQEYRITLSEAKDRYKEVFGAEIPA